jgi:hypothetical protein
MYEAIRSDCALNEEARHSQTSFDSHNNKRSMKERKTFPCASATAGSYKDAHEPGADRTLRDGYSPLLQGLVSVRGCLRCADSSLCLYSHVCYYL